MQYAHYTHLQTTMHCLQLQQGLWPTRLANAAGFKQIMKPNIPYAPCPAPAVAKACKSTHKRCTTERLSPAPFHSTPFFSSYLVLVLPVAKARCQPLRKSRAECPHPLCKWFTTIPQLTHSFCAFPPSSTLHSFSDSLWMIDKGGGLGSPFTYHLPQLCAVATGEELCLSEAQ